MFSSAGINFSDLKFNIQQILENEKVALIPLVENDFSDLYAVAADPKIWEQHPNKDRWKENEFKTFFEGAIKSKGAYKIIEKGSGAIIGSTRFYDFDELENSILIGYTFYATKCWGTGINSVVKAMMLDYAFQVISNVYFHIGANNIRSQIAIGRLGATKIGEQEVAYFGEQSKLNFVYKLNKTDWFNNHRSKDQ